MTLVISKGLTLDNGTRAAAIAGVSPTLDYRFAREKREIETVSLTDKLTFTGGNEGTFVGSDGFIQSATTNVPRFDHDPLSRQSLGLLSEVERTNSLLRSEEFDNASWVKTLTTVTANASTSPAGTTTADKIVVNNGATGFDAALQGATITANAVTAISGFFKAAEYIAVRLSNTQGGNGYAAVYNLATGALISQFITGTGTIVGHGIQALPGGWYRIWVAGTITAGATNAAWRIQISDASGNAVTGNGTSGIFLWGAQLEAGITPSTYIPTTSAAVTRTADSAVIDGTGVLTGTYTLVEKPAGCAVVSGSNINLEPGFTAERVMVFPAALDAGQITAIRGAM